jgi:hypothetical protein
MSARRFIKSVHRGIYDDDDLYEHFIVLTETEFKFVSVRTIKGRSIEQRLRLAFLAV